MHGPILDDFIRVEDTSVIEYDARIALDRIGAMQEIFSLHEDKLKKVIEEKKAKEATTTQSENARSRKARKRQWRKKKPNEWRENMGAHQSISEIFYTYLWNTGL